ncbi:cupin domain-containing protein [Kitasatospora sp. NPDC096140]|uniref:cupin domain-containing protein n=1 Tax=Kitasatospora sp. NPDC096140 TaxID=3155425 RepID=UPI00331C7A67
MADAPVSTRLGGAIRPLLTPKSVGASSGFLGTMTLQPGEFIAEHYHPYSEEFMFVAQGEVVVRIDGEEIVARAHEAVLVPKFRSHRYENRGAEPALMVFQMSPLAPSPEEGHVEVEKPPFPSAIPPVVGK